MHGKIESPPQGFVICFHSVKGITKMDACAANAQTTLVLNQFMDQPPPPTFFFLISVKSINISKWVCCLCSKYISVALLNSVLFDFMDQQAY